MDESGLLPPQSAQPRPSLFGGPSSDVGLQPSSQPEPPRSSLFGGPFTEYAPLEPVPEADVMDEASDLGGNEHDMVMQKQPLMPHGDSENDTLPEENRGRSRRRSERVLQSEPEPIYYVVDRGLDLPPGVERPNLFDGHSSMWRRYNADDIGAYNAIITNRSRDLAAHLYNAHVLRRRTRDTPRKKLVSGEEAIPHVHRRWAAWPVHAAKVPRVDEILRKRPESSEILQMPPDPRPSAGLEQCITATMLKVSKETFQARETDFEEFKDDSAPELGDGDYLMEGELEKKEEDEDEEPVDTRILEPIIQLDDDEVLRKLRPLVRNVISQVDRLLHGLHCAMKGRKYEDEDEDEDDSDDEDLSNSDEEEHDSEEDRESRSRSRGRQSTRQDSRKRETSRRSNSAETSSGPDSDDESLPEVSQSRERSGTCLARHESNHYFRGRLRLRDWSEVMGLASMMGLPRAAVMRASKRCADLFGEDLEFRTMPEGRVRKKQNTGGQDEYVYTESEGESESDSDSAPPSPWSTPQPTDVKSKPNLELKLEPERKAKQTSQRRSRSKMTPAIVPPSESPSPDPEEPSEPTEVVADSIEQTNEEPRAVRPGIGKGPHRKSDLVCPIITCVRHVNGFSRKWNLNQHLKIRHGIHDASEIEVSNERSEGDGVITVE